MLYYDLSDNGTIPGFTNLKWVADIKGYKFTTDENIVMQKDGSGYVLESMYNEDLESVVDAHLTTVSEIIANETADMREQIDAVNDAMVALMFGGDENVS